MQSVPIVVNNVMYAQAGTRRTVVALDPASGEMLWMLRMDEGKRGAAAPRQGSGRGLAYWTDGKGDERIVTVTPGYHMVQLNAKTGVPVASFGRNGVVDLKTEIDQPGIDLETADIGLNSPPALGNNVIVVGRRSPARRRAAREGKHQGLHPRLRRAHRQASVDLPHDSAAGRVRQRHVGEGFVVVHRQRRQLGAHHDR